MKHRSCSPTFRCRYPILSNVIHIIYLSIHLFAVWNTALLVYDHTGKFSLQMRRNCRRIHLWETGESRQPFDCSKPARMCKNRASMPAIERYPEQGNNMNVFDKGLITILACNVFFCLLSLPLIFQKVPRNPVYGYRTRATLSDDTLWYKANMYFGIRFCVMSILSASIAVVLYCRQGLSPEAYLRMTVVLLVVPVLIAGLLTARFIRAIRAGSQSSNDSR